MATTSLTTRGSAATARARDWSPGAVLVALALPILFLHVRYQPGFSVGIGSTSAQVVLSDVVVWVLAAAALAAGLREGFGRLDAARPLWITSALFLAWLAISVGYGATRGGYLFHTHAASAAKWIEYALLAPSLPLLLRRRADLRPVLAALAAWSLVATAVGLLQFFGASLLHAWPAGRRQPSLLGQNDFAALSGMALTAGLWALAFRGVLAGRLLIAALVASGGLGVILAGASAGAVGVAAGAGALALLAWLRGRLGVRETVLGAAAVAMCALGVVALRGNDYAQFLRFVGVAQREQTTTEDVQTYSQRTVLIYIGARIWRHHPVVGVGFDGSNDYAFYGPELPAAHRRFPDVSPLAFPTRDRYLGIQDVYVQTLADLGLVGAALLAALLAAAIAVPARTALRREPGGALALAWFLVALGLLLAQGYVAGIPLDACLWLAVGLAAAAAAWARGAPPVREQ